MGGGPLERKGVARTLKPDIPDALALVAIGEHDTWVVTGGSDNRLAVVVLVGSSHSFLLLDINGSLGTLQANESAALLVVPTGNVNLEGHSEAETLTLELSGTSRPSVLTGVPTRLDKSVTLPSCKFVGRGKSGTKTRTGTGIFRVKARFLDWSWDQNEDYREGAKEYFSCSYSGHTVLSML